MRLSAILHTRCPHCLEGEVFSSLWKMHTHCPVCGVEYEREQGYFMMAIFFGYVLGFLAVLPFCIILFLNDAPIIWYFVVSLVVLLLLSPFIFRYSRVLWMHLDELMDPRRSSS